MKKLNQKGFEAIGAIVIVAVLIVLGGAGWFVYDRQKNTKNAQDAAEVSETSNSNQGGAMDGYLDIPELGIQLKLASGVTDANYAVMGDGSTFGISTNALQQQFGPNCSAASGKVATIAVFVSSNGPNFGTGSTTVDAYPNAFKSADGTYYAINTSPLKEGFCGDAASNQQAADTLTKQTLDGFSKTKVQQLQ